MLKFIINLNFLPCNLYRRWYLNKLKSSLKKDKEYFLCLIRHPLFFIKFYELKEVRANNMSKYLLDRIRDHFFLFKTRVKWFGNKEDRIAFLEECIKINKNL